MKWLTTPHTALLLLRRLLTKTARRHGLTTASVCLMLGLCSTAYAQDADREAAEEAASLEEAERDARQNGERERGGVGGAVAVLPIGEGSQSGPVIETLLSLLDSRGFEVLSPDTLQRRMTSSMVPRTPPEVANQFVGLTPQIARGIERFFYKGNDSALETLTPAVNLGMAHLEVLARRPDFASQVFEAGIVMIRAYRNVKREDDARRLARGLVAAFPGFDLASESAPPAVVDLLAAQRASLEGEGTYMKVTMVDATGCKALVNGTSVGTEAFAVSPDKRYFVTMECGAGTAPLWVVRPERGATVDVPIAPAHPLEYRMSGAGFHQRKRAEGYMRMASFWGRVPRLIGVADADGGEPSESVVLVHLSADGSAGWSDRADESTVSRMLERVMPDFEAGAGYAAAGYGPGTRGDQSQTDWVGWSLVGGGVALAAAGTWGFIAAEQRSIQIACSPDSTSQPSAAECDGVEPVRFDGPQQFDQARSEVTSVRWLSGGGLALGLGLAGWGTYRLINPDERRPAVAGFEWNVQWSPTRVGVSTRLNF